MAQWSGQFTGNTHGTKLADYEAILKNAVETWNTCTETERATKAKTVKKIAGKLFDLRLKAIKAKINDARPVKHPQMARWQVRIERLQQIESRLMSDGIEGILREIGVSDFTI